MALATLAAVLDALPGQVIEFVRATTSSVTPGQYSSLWTGTGVPAPAANPSSGLAGDVPTSATVGALPFVNPASGGTYLARANATTPGGSNANVLFVFDRLWHNSGIDATLLTAQTVNSVALTRPDALGADVSLWWQTYATMGTGTPTVSVVYTNQAGTGSKTATSGALTTAMVSNRTGLFQLASGDTGVRSVQTWQASATFTSGTIGLVMRRLLAVVPVVAANNANGSSQTFDAIACGLAAIPNNACLDVLLLTNTVAAGAPYAGHLMLVQG